MAVIHVTTEIHAPISRVFDLARSIDAHQHGAAQTTETAVAGCTSGLISLNEQVTWRARHFGVWQELTVQITEFDRPNYFQDVMLKGAFARMAHNHYFEERDGKTTMRDEFDYAAPLGILGRVVEKLILTQYLKSFLEIRNAALKELAESEGWRKFLATSPETPTADSPECP